jgi:hypothetical protein
LPARCVEPLGRWNDIALRASPAGTGKSGSVAATR